MICKYCGEETTNTNGICKVCDYKLKMNPNEEGVDIFSSSGATREDFVKINVSRSTMGKNDDVKIADFAPIPPEKKKSKKGVVAIIIAAILLIVGIVLYFTGAFDSSVSRIKEALETGKYTEAVAICDEKFTAEGSPALNQMLSMRLETICDEYNEGVREYTDVNEELDAIKKMDIAALKKKVNSIGTKLSDLKDSKAAFSKAEKYYAKKNYVLCIKEYDKVVENDPNYSEAVTKKKQAVSNYRNSVLSEAAALVNDGNHNGAVKLLRSALKVLGEDKLISKRIKEYKKSQSSQSRQGIIDEADRHALNGDFAAAIKVLLKAQKKNEEYVDDEKINNYLTDYQKQYSKEFSDKIDEYIAKENFEDAARLIEEAEEVIPKSSKLKEKRKIVNEQMPLYLHEVVPEKQTKWTWGTEYSVDSFGVNRAKGSNCILMTTKSTATYYVDDEYNVFKCGLAAEQDIDESVKCKVQIIATIGGEYLYREEEISAETEGQDITMPLENCSSLKISITGEGARVLMYDARLAKE